MSNEWAEFKRVRQCFLNFFLKHNDDFHWAVKCSNHFRRFWHYSKVTEVLAVYSDDLNLGRPSSFLHLYNSESKNCSSACSPCTSITVHITPILGQPHWLPADARISWICMPLFQRCQPLPVLFVSLMSCNCALLLDLFTLVSAPVSCHSHTVGAGREGTVHSLVWAFCSEHTATSHRECNNRRYVLVSC